MLSRDELINRLELATAASDRDRVKASTCDLLEHLRSSGTAVDVAGAESWLGTLRRYRQFEAMQILADGLIRLGCDAPVVYRQYAQGLIDGGMPIAARHLLEELTRRTADDPVEHAEARGLLGRAAKQIYVDTRGRRRDFAREALCEAIDRYWSVYTEDPVRYLWHGVNVVALTCRAARDGVHVLNAPDARDLARAIIRVVDDRVAASVVEGWDCATAAEACLAIDDIDSAERWIRAYVGAPDTDAFAIAGTLRQLHEVWEIDGDAGQLGGLIAVLRAALLQRHGGELRLTPAEVAETAEANQDTFERILGADGTKTYGWLQKGIRRARAVALVRRGADTGVGTGFLVRGGDFHGPLGDELLLLTSSHVVSERPEDQGLPPDEAVAVFTILAAKTKIDQERKVKLIWSSPRQELDATLLRLDPPVQSIEACPIAPQLPLLRRPQRVYVIGHPRGAELSFSLQDNDLIDHGGPGAEAPVGRQRCLLHYRAPTEPGSSGSPVFNQSSWEAIGLHHAGGEVMRRLNGKNGTYAANEGISIQSIVAAARDDLGRQG